MSGESTSSESTSNFVALERAVRRVNRGLRLRQLLANLVRDPLREFKYATEGGSPVLAELLRAYERTDEAGRQRLRALWEKNRSFRENVGVAEAPVGPEAFRLHLLRYSLDYHCEDWRESQLTLNEVCAAAAQAGVDMRPVLEQVAEVSGDEARRALREAARNVDFYVKK